MDNVLKFLTLLFLNSNKMLVIRAGVHKMLVRLVNREYPGHLCLIGCQGFCGRQLLSEILEYLLQLIMNIFHVEHSGIGLGIEGLLVPDSPQAELLCYVLEPGT